LLNAYAHFCAKLPAFICAALPVLTGNFDRIQYWCWFSENSLYVPGANWLGRVEEVFSFFLPLSIAIIFIILVSIKVQIRLNTLRRDLQTANLDPDTARHMRALKRLRLYPVVMVIVFTFPIADQLYLDIRGTSWFALTLCHCFANGCLGLGHCLIYFSNDKTRSKLLQCLCRVEPEQEHDYMETTASPEATRLLKQSRVSGMRTPYAVNSSESLAKLAENVGAVVSPRGPEATTVPIPVPQNHEI
jgi:hypothetical protein